MRGVCPPLALQLVFVVEVLALELFVVHGSEVPKRCPYCKQQGVVGQGQELMGRLYCWPLGQVIW